MPSPHYPPPALHKTPATTCSPPQHLLSPSTATSFPFPIPAPWTGSPSPGGAHRGLSHHHASSSPHNRSHTYYTSPRVSCFPFPTTARNSNLYWPLQYPTQSCHPQLDTTSYSLRAWHSIKLSYYTPSEIPHCLQRSHGFLRQEAHQPRHPLAFSPQICSINIYQLVCQHSITVIAYSQTQ